MTDIKRLYGYLLHHRLQVVAMLCALCCTSLSVLGLGKGLGYVVDAGFATGNTALLNHSLLIVLGLTVLLAVATYCRARLIYTISERVITKIRQDVYGHIIRVAPSYFEQHKTSDVTSRLTNDTTLLTSTIANVISVALRNLIMLVGGLAMLIYTSPKLTMLVLLIVPLVVFPIILLGKRVKRLSRVAQEQVSLIAGHIEESMQGIRTVQAYAREAFETQNFNHVSAAALSANLAHIRVRALLVGIVIFLVFSAITGVLWIGGLDVLHGHMTAGALASFLFYSVIVAASAGWLAEVASDIQRAAAALERLFALFAVTSDVEDPVDPLPLPVPCAGQLTFDAVSFSYPTRPDDTVLRDISLVISPGERIAVVGPSGSGKTTLTQLLLRFYNPSAGRILLDGMPIDRLALAELRHLFGYVSQEPVIFSASARDNILYGNPEASETALMRAAAAAEVTSFVQDLPQGFDTFLGERGVRLSGGQRQRIAIARALLKDPKIILLDEATSNLDSENERLVQISLERLAEGRTTIIIAHRLSTIRDADRILVLDRGQIVGVGTHASLLKEDGLYAKLARFHEG